MTETTTRTLVGMTCIAILAHLAWAHIGPQPALASGATVKCEKVNTPNAGKIAEVATGLVAEGRERLDITAVGATSAFVICAY